MSTNAIRRKRVAASACGLGDKPWDRKCCATNRSKGPTSDPGDAGSDPRPGTDAYNGWKAQCVWARLKRDPEAAGSAASVRASIATAITNRENCRRMGISPVLKQALPLPWSPEAWRGGIDSVMENNTTSVS